MADFTGLVGSYRYLGATTLYGPQERVKEQGKQGLWGEEGSG